MSDIVISSDILFKNYDLSNSKGVKEITGTYVYYDEEIEIHMELTFTGIKKVLESDELGGYINRIHPFIDRILKTTINDSKLLDFCSEVDYPKPIDYSSLVKFILTNSKLLEI